MKGYKNVVLAIGCISVMISASGCANKDVVKKDESLGGKEVTAKTVVAPASTKAASDLKNEEKKASPSILVQPAVSTQQPVKPAARQTAFEKVYFNFDSSDLSKPSRDTLSRNGEILLKENKDVKIRIEGNCDERGSAEYNLALGERRAKAAEKYLVTLGVQPDRLSIISYGKERPAVQGEDEAAWSKNRRDEFVIQK